ncbi:hypothetical protein Goshw_016813, partial [Gossypium schwendimanii]|nr:hypothetical protein [Gossypium schwendimanii]
MGYDGVRIQSNSMEVVKPIQDSSPPSWNNALVRSIQHLLGSRLDKRAASSVCDPIMRAQFAISWVWTN